MLQKHELIEKTLEKIKHIKSFQVIDDEKLEYYEALLFSLDSDNVYFNETIVPEPSKTIDPIALEELKKTVHSWMEAMYIMEKNDKIPSIESDIVSCALAVFYSKEELLTAKNHILQIIRLSDQKG